MPHPFKPCLRRKWEHQVHKVFLLAPFPRSEQRLTRTWASTFPAFTVNQRHKGALPTHSSCKTINCMARKFLHIYMLRLLLRFLLLGKG